MSKTHILFICIAIAVMAIALSPSVPAALSAPSTALPCLIAGTVTVNGVPTSGVTVTAPGAYQTSTTDSSGAYYLSVPGNGQTIQVTASYNGHSVTSDPFQATVSSYNLDIPITYDVATPTQNATATPTATPAPTQAPTQAPAAPARSQQVVYVTVTVTPEPAEAPNTTINEMLNVSDASVATPVPLPVPTKARSPGFEVMLALACLAGATLARSARKER